MSDKVILHLFSGELIVENSHPGIEEELHYWHKTLVEDPRVFGKKQTKRERSLLFNVLQENGPRRILTFQGFADRLVHICKKCNLECNVLDRRMPFPGPQLKFIKGFRGSQGGLFLRLLHANRSGILKAPTRYGKTAEMINVLRVFPGLKTILTAPEAGLLGQLQKELQAALPEREIRGIFSGSKGKKESDDITIVSMDSLHKVAHEHVRLILVDEPHALASPSRIMEFEKFKNARVLGFGASTSGRFDGADKIIEGLIGPVLVEKTFKEAVAEKAICPIVVYMLEVKFDEFKSPHRQHAYGRLVFHSPIFLQTIATLCDTIIPVDWQTVVFIAEAAQGDHLQTIMMEKCEIAVAQRMTNIERKERFAAMARGEIKRCAATVIYSTGVTFPHLRCAINAAGGGGSITGTQKPGRLAQNQPGKVAGYMFDFLFDCVQHPVPETGPAKPETEKKSLLEMHDGAEKEEKDEPGWMSVVRDSRTRLRLYKKLGYEVRVIKDLNELDLK